MKFYIYIRAVFQSKTYIYSFKYYINYVLMQAFSLRQNNEIRVFII